MAMPSEDTCNSREEIIGNHFSPHGAVRVPVSVLVISPSGGKTCVSALQPSNQLRTEKNRDCA